jgi:glutamate/aspartate transport system substrate-binding protein
MMRDGRASAFVMDGILLAAMIANADDPEKYSLSTDAFGTSEPYGLMMRRDDVEFKTAINDALSQIFKSGEIKGIYDKWFMSPIPPQGVNLRLPVSEALQKAFLTPSELSGE